ncbi:MAG: universal stress protein [Caulobacterales bacterium]|nr:universal stress protein [Caulobacterales bacterium]
MNVGKRDNVDAVARLGAPPAPGLEGPSPIDTILVASDLSARSDRALERAVALAVEHDSRLVVTHVLDDELPAAAQDRMAVAAKDEIGASLAKADCPGGLDCAIDIRRGADHRDILRAAEACEADLVVLGVHRNETAGKPFTGTTVERAIRQGRRPILVVSDRVRGPYDSVVIGTDFSVFSRFAIRAAAAVAPSASLHLAHAFLVPFAGFQGGPEIRRGLREDFEAELGRVVEQEMDALVSNARDGAQTRPIEKIVRHGEARVVLRAEVERVGAQLIVVGTHGRVGIAHALLGSVAENILTQPPCDVLVVKAW